MEISISAISCFLERKQDFRPSSSSLILSLRRESHTALSGMAISAAWVGVDALRSAVRSDKVVSVSWPTAEIKGIELS